MLSPLLRTKLRRFLSTALTALYVVGLGVTSAGFAFYYQQASRLAASQNTANAQEVVSTSQSQLGSVPAPNPTPIAPHLQLLPIDCSATLSVLQAACSQIVSVDSNGGLTSTGVSLATAPLDVTFGQLKSFQQTMGEVGSLYSGEQNGVRYLAVFSRTAQSMTREQIIALLSRSSTPAPNLLLNGQQ